MRRHPLTRRDLLLKGVALGSVTVGPELTVSDSLAAWQSEEAAARKPTAWNELGPIL